MAHGNEINNQRFYWLQLETDFLNNPRLLKLRKIAGGDTYTIIYLKMMLLTIENEGIYVFEGIGNTLAEELSLKLNEEETNVQVVINFLNDQKMIEEKSPNEILLPEAKDRIGSKTMNAIYKQIKKEESVGKIPTKFQPNSNQIPTLKEKNEKEKIISSPNNIYNNPNTLEKLKEKEESSSKENIIPVSIEDTTRKKKGLKPSKTGDRKKIPPQFEWVKAYCEERNNNVDPQTFMDFYDAKNWYLGKNKIVDWQACIRTWERNNQNKNSKPTQPKYTRENKPAYVSDDYFDPNSPFQ